jgi:hypothetical protein
MLQRLGALDKDSGNPQARKSISRQRTGCSLCVAKAVDDGEGNKLVVVDSADT